MTKAERKANAKQAYAALMKWYPFTLENLDGEQWANIAGYEGLYQISTFGRVKSFARKKTIIKVPWVDRNGYLHVGLSKGKNLKSFMVSRLVAIAFIPNTNNLPQVDHRWGMKFDNSADNLRWVTSSENNSSAVSLGIKQTGGDNYQAGVTNEQACYIRENPDNLSIAELAKKFSVTSTTITYIQLGKTYKNAGGTIRGKLDMKKISVAVRQQIRAEYARGTTDFGSVALGKKYNVTPQTILRIINEK